jgi:hypothetical protein
MQRRAPPWVPAVLAQHAGCQFQAWVHALHLHGLAACSAASGCGDGVLRAQEHLRLGEGQWRNANFARKFFGFGSEAVKKAHMLLQYLIQTKRYAPIEPPTMRSDVYT